ncbi:MAG: class II aldolase/adducin family protein [Candidatus Methylophosphatis roskildensis]
MSPQADLRRALLDTARAMQARGLSRGTAGNLSVRCAVGAHAGFLITPSGIDNDAASAEDMVEMTLDGRHAGPMLPSSEWRFHRDIYVQRAEAGAILHAHSPFATALACQGRPIPAFHYMIARFGGSDIRCARYATFGTQALSDAALDALQGRSACLLANHGMLVFGRDLPRALALAIEFETLCEQYWRTLQIGPPQILDAAEMRLILEKFATYGQQTR